MIAAGALLYTQTSAMSDLANVNKSSAESSMELIVFPLKQWHSLRMSVLCKGTHALQGLDPDHR